MIPVFPFEGLLIVAIWFPFSTLFYIIPFNCILLWFGLCALFGVVVFCVVLFRFALYALLLYSRLVITLIVLSVLVIVMFLFCLLVYLLNLVLVAWSLNFNITSSPILGLGRCSQFSASFGYICGPTQLGFICGPIVGCRLIFFYGLIRVCSFNHKGSFALVSGVSFEVWCLFRSAVCFRFRVRWCLVLLRSSA